MRQIYHLRRLSFGFFFLLREIPRYHQVILVTLSLGDHLNYERSCIKQWSQTRVMESDCLSLNSNFIIY